MRDLIMLKDEALELLDQYGIDLSKFPNDIEWTVSKRARSRYGMCKRKFGNAYEINISEFLLNETITPDDDAPLNTLIHEILHAITPNDHHGGEWKRLANLVTKRSGGRFNIKRCSSYEEKGIKRSLIEKPKKIKYIVECPKCGRQWKFERMCKTVKYPEWYSCTNDGCNLRLISCV